jgi:hypothetical protein
MGGAGTGRWRRRPTHRTVFDYRQIDVRDWYRQGKLSPDNVFGLSWKQGGAGVACLDTRAGS